MDTWYILLTIGIIAFIIEIFTTNFIFASIGIGFFFSAFGSYISLSTHSQIILFALGVGLNYFFVKPIITKYGYRNNHIKTNKDALINKKGVVSEEINSSLNTGRVKIDGDDWKAKSLNNKIIKLGTVVQIIEIDSIVLIVKPLNL